MAERRVCDPATHGMPEARNPMDDVVFERSYDDLTARVYTGTSSGRLACQTALLEQHFPVPLNHRIEWAEQMQQSADSLFLAISDRDGVCRYGFAINSGPSRALPGHRVLRVERLRPSDDQRHNHAAVEALHDYAASDLRVLRVHVELFSLDAGRRDLLGRRLRRTGSRRVKRPSRSYADTLVLDVTPPEDSIFRGLRSTARRYIRAVDKHPLRIGPIQDSRYESRIADLLRESFARTGGVEPEMDWQAVMTVANEHPDLTRLVGLFRTDDDSPEGLLAFEWACAHGDHVEDVLAGAARPPDFKISVAMPLVWDVVRWTKSIGATWLDLGGVPGAPDRNGESLRGITEFKLRFTQRVETVGEEWVFEPRPLRSRLARAIGNLAHRVRSHSSLQLLVTGGTATVPIPF